MLKKSYIKLCSLKLEELKNQGNYRYFNYLQKDVRNFPEIVILNKNVVNFCGNDYLGMSVNAKVINESCKVARKCGLGSGGTRNIGGSNALHMELERKLAKMHKKDAALVFNSAYMANLTGLSVLGKLFENALMISDEHNHASIINGIRSSGAKKAIYRHNDLESLEQILQGSSEDSARIIVFESVYSILGTKAPIKEICKLANKYGAITYIDEVHSVGLYGKNGYGVVEEMGLEGEIDVINGTFAKGYGVIGGYIAGNSEVIDCVRSFGNGFIFTTSIPPAICAAVLKSIEVVEASYSLREKFFANVGLLREELIKNGVEVFANDSHIIAVVIGDGQKCLTASRKLLEEGFYVQPINYPTVPHGQECLRITVSPLHKKGQIKDFARSIKMVLGQVK